MQEAYTPAQRRLQDEFDTRKLADRVVEAIITEEFTPPQIDFIHGRNMLFLSTVDETGFPSVSYKGGAAGFVRVPSSRLLYFPIYDGNGMFVSAGNIEARGKVGLLFIDFEIPRRLRARGDARLLRQGPMLAGYPGALAVVEVSIDRVWQNCPRYVPKMQPVSPSPYLPDAEGKSKLAMWKRIDLIQDVISEADRAAAAGAGLISVEEYEANVEKGIFG